MGRRRFLETLSTLGISSATLPHLSQETLAKETENPKKEIPRLLGWKHVNHEEVENGKRPVRNPKFYSIKKGRWRRTEGPIKGAKLVSKKYSSPLIDVGVGREIDGWNLGISVSYNIHTNSKGETNKPNISFDDVKKKAPDKVTVDLSHNGRTETVQDIPVKVEKRRTKDQACEYSDNYDPIPGGCEAGKVQNSSSCGFSLATPAFDNDKGFFVLVTAAHAIDRTYGKDVYQPSVSSNTYAGFSYSWIPSGSGDVGLLRDPSDWTYNIASNYGGYDWQIMGSLAQDKLSDMAHDGDSLYVQGRYSGRNSGEILELSTDGDGHKVKIDVNTSGGDSGGAYFHVDSDGDAIMAGVHANGVDWDNNGSYEACGGTAMYYAEDYLDIDV